MGLGQSSSPLGDHDGSETSLKLQLKSVDFELGSDSLAGGSVSLLSESDSLLGNFIGSLVLGIGSLGGTIGGSASSCSTFLRALEVLALKGSGIGLGEGGLRDDLLGDG